MKPKPCLVFLIVVLSVMAGLAAEASVGFSTSGAAPAVDVIASYDGGDVKTMSARNGVDLPAPNNRDRTLGQTFTLAAAAQVNRITVKMGGNASIKGNVGDHILWLAIMSDTDGDGSVDTLRGTVNAYDLSGFKMEADSYLTFEFDPLSLDTGLHGFEFGWREEGANAHDHNTQNLVLRRTTSGTYAGGSQISKPSYFSFPNILSGHPSNDLYFYVQTVPGEKTDSAPRTIGLISAFGIGMVIVRKKQKCRHRL